MRAIRLAFESVGFRRADATLLDGVSWRVREGEQWAVLGRNGSGKTTLLQIAVGYLPASHGRVYLLDGYLSEITLPEVRKRVGFVSNALSDHLLRWRESTTGLDLVLSGKHAALDCFYRATEPERETALGILDWLNATPVAARPIARMSTGERQRCLIARAWYGNPDLILLDEPCAGLDIAAREQILDAVAEGIRRRPGVPHVLVTHHVEEIPPEISHVLLLKGGRVLAAGAKGAVLNAANLSEAFDITLHVCEERGRYRATVSGEKCDRAVCLSAD